jgi:hypothetical protein
VYREFEKFFFPLSVHHPGIPGRRHWTYTWLAFLLLLIFIKKIINKLEVIMKTKKNKKRLALNKISIAKLDLEEMNRAKSGSGRFPPITAPCIIDTVVE